jgi:hypothetical protein
MLSLLLSLLLAADPSVVAIAPNGAASAWSIPAGSDAWPALDAAQQAAYPGGTVFWPMGVSLISRTLEIAPGARQAGPGSDKCELRPLDPATFKGPLVMGGGYTGCRWARADKATIEGITLRQTSCTSNISHCMGIAFGDRVLLRDVVIRDAKHEGVVAGGWTRNWIVDNCRAYDIGAGSQYRSLSGAAWNLNGHYHTVTDTTAERCGQGFECAGTGNTFIRCSHNGVAAGATPAVGFNIGNAVAGTYRTTLVDCSTNAVPSAVGFGNVIGRAGGLAVVRFVSNDGTIGFSGGKASNTVPHPDEGPDLAPSFIVGSTVRVTRQQSGVVGFHYNTGPALTDVMYGRADLTLAGCTVELRGLEPDWYGGIPFVASGAITGRYSLYDCRVVGMRGAPKSGDFLQQSNGNSAALNPSPNVRVIGGSAVKDDGTPRFFSERRQVAQ